MIPQNGNDQAGRCFDTVNLTSKFRVMVQSRLAAVSKTIDRVLEKIKGIPGVEPYLEEISLALDEALTNAIIHGNREDPRKQVEICGGYDQHGNLLLAVTDEGQGFNPETIPDPTAGENIYSTHGRGVYLIHQLMDHAEYRLGGRQVVLRKHLGAPHTVG